MVAHLAKVRVLLPLGIILVGAALAGAGTISNAIFRIEASNDAGSGYLEFYANELSYNSTTNLWTWSKGLREVLNDEGDPIACLDSANLIFKRDPTPSQPYRINLDFAVHAGASLTTFSVSSALLTFSTPLPAEMLQEPNGGRASASLTLTDENHNGAELLGTGSSGIGAYRAHYNGQYPAGTTFSTLINLLFAGPGGGDDGGQNYPDATNYASIDTTVGSMSAGLGFTLTAGDSGSGTTSYRILPEPASLLMAVVGILAFARRR